MVRVFILNGGGGKRKKERKWEIWKLDRMKKERKERETNKKKGKKYVKKGTWRKDINEKRWTGTKKRKQWM